MIAFLSKLFIKDRENYKDESVRRAYGVLCGFVGIFFNAVLFLGKLIAGTLAGSIAVTADAFNNLSDAGSSIITLTGFKLAGQKPDPEHPFGHGRLEYVAGLLVSVVILIMGFELGKTSFSKILNPEPVEFSVLTVVILVFSICVKLYMCFYNRKIGKKIDSPAMRATALDSLSDTIATSVVLVTTILSKFTGWNIDGWCGIAVAIFICVAGIKALLSTISPLLGQPPTDEFVHEIEATVLAHPEVIGTHDLVVHDYGPGRRMISLHAEIPCESDILSMHDCIDNIERELREKCGCSAVIHMDPVVTDNENMREEKEKVCAMIREIDPCLTIHDFRMVVGPTHTNIIFDIVAPFGFPLSDRELKDRAAEIVSALGENYFAVVDIDKSYTGKTAL